jgi:creatinine amidohydrolase/Fe(II)-dependent formamide hydrolase-like protein
MSQKNNRINLEGKMDDWGPFGTSEGKWLIFSIGNPVEGHGYALPRNIDDLHSQRIAHLISCRTGARYVAHIPWATDNFTAIAKDWAPKSIPVREIVSNIIEFIRFHIDIYKKMDLPTSNVFIYSGHGGNRPIADYVNEIKNALKLEKLIIANTEDFADDIEDRALDEVTKLSKELAGEDEDPKQIRRALVQILLSIAHAGHFEHSLGAALGILDREKLDIMNLELERDFEAALKKWPPLGGLGGFLLAGSEYQEALGTKENDKFGLWKCLKRLRRLDNGKVKVFKELGELMINLIVEYFSNIILNA